LERNREDTPGLLSLSFEVKIKPPPLEVTDARYPGNDPKYAGFNQTTWPLTECLKDTVDRFLPFWNDTIAPCVALGKTWTGPCLKHQSHFVFFVLLIFYPFLSSF